jgi:hypothetical protein
MGSADITETCSAFPSDHVSFRSGLPISAPNDTSPLLQLPRGQVTEQNLSRRWHTARLSVSGFIDRNAGLLLVAASQFFFSAMNVCVKWLNTMDEPVPTLEVCHSFMLFFHMNQLKTNLFS